jgi:hypothetical protein
MAAWLSKMAGGEAWHQRIVMAKGVMASMAGNMSIGINNQ